MNDNKPIINFITSRYNKLERNSTNYKVLLCKFGSSCSKGSKCCYCHKGEDQNKTVKTDFYDFIKEKKLLSHILEYSTAFKFISKHCEKNLKSLEYINKDPIDFKEKLSGQEKWLIDFSEEYFRRRVFCYRHIKSFYVTDCSAKCTGGINCCYGNHNINCKISDSKIEFIDEKSEISKKHVDEIVKYIIKKMTEDIQKYNDLITGCDCNKKSQLFVEYIRNLITSIREYSSWVYSEDEVIELMESFDEYGTSSILAYPRDLSPGGVQDIESDIYKDTFSNDLGFDLCYEEVNQDLESLIEQENVISIEFTDNTNEDGQKRSKSQDFPKTPNKTFRSNSKSFSCGDDLKRFEELNRDEEFLLDDSLNGIMSNNLELSDSFDEIDFSSVDRSLMSPATWRWIKDFRKSKTPEFRGSNSPFSESLNNNFLELSN